MMAEERLLIQIKDSVTKPQQKTISLAGRPWDIEWSTTSGVPMTIDFFNLTVIKYRQTEHDDKKQGEEYWRTTGIPGHARKIQYGMNLLQSTSTQSKPLTDGIYAIKISGMSAITEGLYAETGMGVALVKIAGSGGVEKTDVRQSKPAKNAGEDPSAPVTITSEALKNLFTLTE